MAVKSVQATVNGLSTQLAYDKDSKAYKQSIPALSAGNFIVEIKAYDEAGNAAIVDTDNFPVLLLCVERWKPPKIWVQTDYFNIDDYNRIKGNIEQVYMLSILLYPSFSIQDMGAEKTYIDWIYADEINKFEGNLETIKNKTYRIDIGDTKAFYANEAFVDYIELNRLESACLKYYNLLKAQKDNKEKLKYRLGNKGGVKT